MNKKWTGVCAAVMVYAIGVYAGSFGTPAAERTVSATDGWEATASADYIFPGIGDFDIYEFGLGAQTGLRRWWDVLGVELGLGIENWAAGGSSRNWPGIVDGNTLAVPLKLSGLWKVSESSCTDFSLHAGVGYRFVSADLSLQSGGLYDEVDIEGSWFVEVGGEVSWRFAPDWSCTVGLAYQNDLSASEARAFGGALEDHSFQSVHLTICASYAF